MSCIVQNDISKDIFESDRKIYLLTFLRNEKFLNVLIDFEQIRSSVFQDDIKIAPSILIVSKKKNGKVIDKKTKILKLSEGWNDIKIEKVDSSSYDIFINDENILNVEGSSDFESVSASNGPVTFCSSSKC